MALSAFDDPDEPPDAAQIREVLGAAAPLWGRVVEGVSAAHGPVEARWNFAGARFGWSMRLARGDRVVLHLTPCAGHFLAGLALGEKAVAAAKEAGLPPDVEAALDAAPRYAEGRGLRHPVRAASDVAAVLVLVGAKLGTTGPSSVPGGTPRAGPARGRPPEDARPCRTPGPRPAVPTRRRPKG